MAGEGHRRALSPYSHHLSLLLPEICSILLRAKGCGWVFLPMEINPQWERESRGGQAEGQVHNRCTRSEAERQQGLRALQWRACELGPERDGGQSQGAEGGHGHQRGSDQQGVNEDNTGHRQGNPWAIMSITWVDHSQVPQTVLSPYSKQDGLFPVGYLRWKEPDFALKLRHSYATPGKLWCTIRQV